MPISGGIMPISGAGMVSPMAGGGGGEAMVWGGIPAGKLAIPSCAANTGCNKARTSGGVSIATSSPTKEASSSTRASTERMSPRRLFIKISGESGKRFIMAPVS